MGRNISDAVRALCLAFPEAEEFLSHGSPNFRARGKTFAVYSLNHHGDGRVALWLNSPPGAQEVHTRGEPKHFFVPPYVGPRGWLGVNLDKGLSWKRIALLTREAYEHVVPSALAARITKTPEITGPVAKLTASEIDPLKQPRAIGVIERLRKIVLAWPEVSEGSWFGSPVWIAGKKNFVIASRYEQRLRLSVWVGVDRQPLLTGDERYRLSPYIGHNGWIDLDVEESCDWDEIRSLALQSYRHFANKRMLSQLDGSDSFSDAAFAKAPVRKASAKRASAPRTARVSKTKRKT